MEAASMNSETRERIQDLIRRADDGDLTFHSLTTELQDILDASPEPARAEPVAWKAGPGIFVREEDALAYCSDMMREDGPMPLYAAPHPPALPPGWVAVPVEPTEEMLLARIVEPLRGLVKGHEAEAEVLECERSDYRNMLAAAPPCPAVTLPDGWPWNPVRRAKMSRILMDVAAERPQAPISKDTAKAIRRIARWLDRSPEQGGRSDG
jgi:hypothetical protein